MNLKENSLKHTQTCENTNRIFSVICNNPLPNKPIFGINNTKGDCVKHFK